jgi:hypothetical protein
MTSLVIIARIHNLKYKNEEESMARFVSIAVLMAAGAFAAWQPATNLGATVNTSSGEWCPLVAEDGSYIIFVSDRGGGYGGTDLWRTVYSGGAWQTPVNMGANVNTSSGENVPCLSYGENRLYFISNCPGGQGSNDIWYCTLTGGTAGPKTNLGPTVNTSGSEC